MEPKGAWATFIDGLMGAVAKATVPLLAFLAGRKSIEQELDKLAKKEAEDELGNSREVSRKRDDASERERVRTRFEDKG